MSLADRLRLAKIILQYMSDEQLYKRSKLYMKAKMNGAGWYQFVGLMNFLFKNGYIERVTIGKYRITERGKDFLKAL